MKMLIMNFMIHSFTQTHTPRKRDRETKKKRDIQKERQTKREKGKQRRRQGERDREGKRERQTKRERGMEAYCERECNKKAYNGKLVFRKLTRLIS
jgi:hypothetical protein